MNKFLIDSLGCKVNSYEIEAIKDELLAKNFIQVFDTNEADYIIINTCCVTNNAASKSRQKINSYHHLNLKAKIIVMGCYVQGFKDEVLKIDGVSLLVGTNNRKSIVEYMVKDIFDKQINLVDDIKNFTSYENLAITSCFENTRAYLKIQDGCNNFCSYCIIPYVRGIIKSRPYEEVIKEAKELIKKGYKEIVLTGIHTGSYGKDLKNFTFSDLVEKLLEIDGLYRLRISSIEESEIDEKLINLLINNPKLAKHLHMPLQAGSDHVLKLMNRKYDLKTYIDKVKYIQDKVKDIAITTDIIVGFPQESDEDFNSTLEACKQIGYMKIHVFPFSSRKGTVASKMQGQINGVIKKSRTHQLLDLSNKLNLKYNENYLDKCVDVLVEEKVNDFYLGHTSNFLHVKFKTNKNIARNDIINIRITKAFENDVEGIMEEEYENK